MKVNPAVHQLVYVHLGGGYAKEMRGPHWCYVVKNNGQKLTIIPLTSIKEDSGPAKEPFELDIDEGNGKKGRMYFDDMRSIDKMRVIEKKGTVLSAHQEPTLKRHPRSIWVYKISTG
ncbi:MAG: type II toxin-antitoxin system PemK/MazF family toxin [Candidatus Ornithospirochaeta sp.]